MSTLRVVCFIALIVVAINTGTAPMFADEPGPEAQWVALDAGPAGTAPQFTVLESNERKTVFEVTVPGFWVSPRQIEDRIFQELLVPGHAGTIEVGKPALPVIRAIVAIPCDASVNLSWTSSGSASFENYKVFPFQRPQVDNRNEPAEFAFDEAAYRSSESYPDAGVLVSEPAVWRNLRVVTVEILPMHYVAGHDRLLTESRFIIELNYLAGSTVNVLDRRVGEIPPYLDKIYRKRVINYDWLQMPQSDGRSATGTEYLILTHPNFESAIQPLAEWHHKEGLKTEVVAITTTDPQTIKNEITTRYNQGDLEYVLLVGDTNYIPVYMWTDTLGTYASDYWYACITGSPDLYADVAIGRLSVTGPNKVQNQVNKILKYEKEPPLDAWLEKILLVAHKEEAPGKYVGCKITIDSNYIPQPPYDTSTAYGHLPDGVNSKVTDAINEGRVIVNYRGHGSKSAWTGWGYNNDNWTTLKVGNLSNGDRTPVVFNIACRNNRIQSSCLGEAWVDEYPGGAVASLGSTEDSYTTQNHTYDKWLFRAIFEDDLYRIGWISNEASSHLVNLGQYAKANIKMYLWLGDPATEVWTDIPDDLTVDHPALIEPGTPESVDVTVTYNSNPVQEATVCLYKDGEIYEVDTTNAAGVANFSVTASTAGTMHVTVSKHDYLPYEGEVVVCSQSLSCEASTIPEATPSAVDFLFDAGVGNAGDQYFLMCGLMGTSPGTTLPGGLVVPCNWDPVVMPLVRSLNNIAIFIGFIDTLDVNGQAFPRFEWPGYPGSAGLIIYFAGCTIYPFDFVSNSVEIEVVP